MEKQVIKHVKFPKSQIENFNLKKEDILAFKTDHEMVDAFLVNDHFEVSFFKQQLKRSDISKYRKTTQDQACKINEQNDEAIEPKKAITAESSDKDLAEILEEEP